MLKKVNTYSLLIWLVLIASTDGREFSADSFFEMGNQAYQKEDYKQAVDYYSRIINSGIKNHTVHYNLANAYFREEKLGQAIVNYNRALMLSPRDEDVLANLEYARLFVVDKITVRHSNSLITNIDRFLGFWTPNELNVVFAFSYLGLAALLILRVFSKSRDRLLGSARMVFAVLFLASGASFALKVHALSTQRGVIVEDGIDIKSGPGEEWTTQVVAHQGLELVIQAKAGEWYQVGLPNQVIGWVLEDSVERI